MYVHFFRRKIKNIMQHISFEFSLLFFFTYYLFIPLAYHIHIQDRINSLMYLLSLSFYCVYHKFSVHEAKKKSVSASQLKQTAWINGRGCQRERGHKRVKRVMRFQGKH